MEEKAKGLLEPEGLDESKETVSSRYKYEPILWQYEQSLPSLKPEGFSLLRVGSSHGFSTLKQKLSATDIHLQTKISFL